MNYNIRSKKTVRSTIRKIIVAIEIIVLIAASAFTWVYAKYGNMNIRKLDLKKVDVNDIDKESYTGFTSIALFGLDSRDTELKRGNSDTIIIASINNDTNEIRMVSVYRDTYVSMGSSYSGYAKANAAYGNGGAEQALSMLNTNLDLNLQDYVTVNWAAMIDAIDLIGGIDLEITGEEAYWANGYQVETAKSCGKLNEVEGLALQDGVQHLNGVQATAFCRIRYTKGDDFKRTERQRIVIEKCFEKAKTLGVEKINEIMDKVFPQISTNLKFSKLIKLAVRLMDFKIGKTSGFPYTKSTGMAGKKGSCVFCNDLVGDVAKLHMDLYGEKDYQPSSVVQELSPIICKNGATSANSDSSSSDSSSKNNNSYTDSSQNQYYEDSGNSESGESGGSESGGGSTDVNPGEDVDSDSNE